MKKIKNIILSIAITLSIIPTKIFAVVNPNNLNINPQATLYGVNRVREYHSWMPIVKVFVIPIIVLIGITTYCLKSKSSKKKKIIISLLLILIGVAMSLIIDWIYFNI